MEWITSPVLTTREHFDFENTLRKHFNHKFDMHRVIHTLQEHNRRGKRMGTRTSALVKNIMRFRTFLTKDYNFYKCVQ